MFLNSSQTARHWKLYFYALLRISFVASTSASFATNASSNSSNIFSGYVKSYALFQDTIAVEGLENSDTLIKSGFQSQNSLRLMNSYLSDSGNIEIHYEIQPLYLSNPIFTDDGSGLGSTISVATNRYRIDDLNPVFKEVNDNTVILQNLDRFNYQYNGELGDLTIGRQVVSFGSARFINPTDIFVPFSIQTLNQEYRVGIDAIRFQADLGGFATFDTGIIVGKDAKAENSAAFMRGKNSIAGNDIEGMVIFLSDAWLVGAGIERALGNFGFWFETAFMQWREKRLLPLDIASEQALLDHEPSLSIDSSLAITPDSYWRSSIGLDYSLSDNIIAMFEYHYNGAGTSQSENYTQLRHYKSHQKAGVFLLGKHYLIPAVSWIASPLLSVSASAFINVQDRSAFLNIKGERSWSDNLYSDFGAYLSTGKSFYASPLTPQINDELNQTINYGSEFGGYPTSVYASLRYYF